VKDPKGKEERRRCTIIPVLRVLLWNLTFQNGGFASGPFFMDSIILVTLSWA
jgi:hypothetical protein